jgi:hypothetical protein
MTAFCIGVGVLYAGIGALSAAVPALRFVIVFVAVLAPLALLGLLVWLSVRLAPAAALSIAQQRFVFFDAWRLTRPYFWQMLGAFVVLWIGYFVVALVLGSIVELPLTQAMTPIMQEAMSGGDAGELAARMMALWTSPTTMAFMGLSLIVSAAIACVLYIAFFGVNARVVEAAGEERGGAGAGA